MGGSKAQILVTAAWALALAFLVVLTMLWNLGRETANTWPFSIFPQDPVVTYGHAMRQLRDSNGRSLPAVLPTVDRAVHLDPLDGRPLLFHALKRILTPNASPPVALLEAARDQNPRLGETRLLLLDAYGRAGRGRDAMAEAKTLMDLMPDQRLLVIRLLAGLAGRPGGPDALMRGLPASAVKGDVMLRLERTGADPALIARLAAAMHGVGRDPSQRGWIGQLVADTLRRSDPQVARSLWATLYGVDPAGVGTTIADPQFDEGKGIPPFAWTLPTGNAGIAEVHGKGLDVYYYGRDSAVFASQMLMLPPGAYSLASRATTTDTQPPGGLSWELACTKTHASLVSARLPTFLPATGGAVPFSIPADGCPVQTLQLVGNPSELPGNETAHVERVTIERKTS